MCHASVARRRDLSRRGRPTVSGGAVAAVVPRHMRRSWTRAGNHIGVWMYRTLNGRLSSGSRNAHVLTITSPEVRERQFAARPRELHDGERDAMWREVILAQAPEVSRYAQKAGRAIPVAVLEPA